MNSRNLFILIGSMIVIMFLAISIEISSIFILKKISIDYLLLKTPAEGSILSFISHLITKMVEYRNAPLDYQHIKFFFIFIYFSVIFSVWFFFSKNPLVVTNRKTILNFIFQKRLLIATIMFVLLVAGKVNFSSIAIWNDYLENPQKDELLSGIPRSIRSDEFLVNTPRNLAQAMNQDFYPQINKNVSMNGTNMNIPISAPVWDITLIGKPTNWGYFLFGRDYGFSWWWCLRLVLLFLISFEFCLFLTKNNRIISFLGALWLTLLPHIQWWFSTNFVDIVIYTFSMIVCAHYYFENHESTKKRRLMLVLFFLSTISFVFCFYPAMQIIAGNMTLLVLAYIFYQNRNKLHYVWKDKLTILLLSVVLVGVLAYFVISSREALETIMGTVYPGKRIYLGGHDTANTIFNFIPSWILSFIDTVNNCELSGSTWFLLFIPFMLIYYRKIQFTHKSLILALFFYLLLLLSYVYLPIQWPTLFAKATLFSMGTGRSMIYQIDIISVIISITLLAVPAKGVHKILALFITILIGVVSYYGIQTTLYELNPAIVIASVIGFSLLGYLFIVKNKKIFIPLMIVAILINGLFVNPITIGTASIYKQELSKEIRTIHEQEKNTVWLANTDLVLPEFLIANGVKTINGTHVYPDLQLYRTLDLDRDPNHEKIYNRFAHVTVNIVAPHTPAKVQLIQSDWIDLQLAPEHLAKLEVTHILSQNDLTQFNTDQYRFKEIHQNQQSKLKIYKFEKS